MEIVTIPSHIVFFSKLRFAFYTDSLFSGIEILLLHVKVSMMGTNLKYLDHCKLGNYWLSLVELCDHHTITP